jgi:hypothetical protein
VKRLKIEPTVQVLVYYSCSFKFVFVSVSVTSLCTHAVRYVHLYVNLWCVGGRAGCVCVGVFMHSFLCVNIVFRY